MTFHSRHNRIGYSLLEVLLALALSMAVFSAIAMGIHTHLVNLTQQKVRIERKQIARSILAMMSNDLRAGIQYKAADYSGLENLVKTQQMKLALIAAPTATGDSESSGKEEDESSVIQEDEVAFRPTLRGSSSVIALDISRLPRLDQYNPLIASTESLMQSPSDVKSIAYFFSDNKSLSKAPIEFDSAAPGGLYRREIDRAVAAYRGDFELVTSPDVDSQLVAGEVAELGFRYFDGSDWKTSWNSEDDNGFPLAIEINLVIDPARSSTNNTTYSYGGFDRTTMEGFRSVVHIPVAEVMEDEDE